jgi:ADP-heptose:LPS heptosyltransferase
MNKALLVNISDIGDIVSSSIILESLRKNYKVSFMMPKFVHGLWENDTAIKLHGLDEIPQDHFDLVIDLTSDKASRKIVRSIKADRKIGRIKNTWQRMRHWWTYSDMVSKKFDGHIVGDYTPVLSILKDQSPRVPSLSGVKKWPEKFSFSEDEKVVSIHFGAHNPKRVIPEALISHVIKNLNEQGYKIVLIGSEEHIAKEIIKKNADIPTYKPLTLSEVKNVLLCSKLFIGADSGILHISAALGVSSIGVYGPNVPRRSGPRSEKVTFFEQKLDCRPCNQNIECPIDVKCMKTLDKNVFWDLILDKLRQ